ncbi:MAG TPA: hypothetical protein VGE69_13645 [Pseudomonadales bacterium]
MNAVRSTSIVLLALLLAACASGPSANEVAAQQAAAEAAERAAAEAQLEAQHAEQERLIAEERARAAAAAQAEENARREAVARAAEAAEQERRQQQAEAERRRQQPAAPSAEARAQAVARQQERIATLRTQIADNQAETTNLESANATLLQAITAAENLVTTLTQEQEKYTNRDPATGATVEPLSKERIAELNAELERLQAQAGALSEQQP